MVVLDFDFLNELSGNPSMLDDEEHRSKFIDIMIKFPSEIAFSYHSLINPIRDFILLRIDEFADAGDLEGLLSLMQADLPELRSNLSIQKRIAELLTAECKETPWRDYPLIRSLLNVDGLIDNPDVMRSATEYLLHEYRENLCMLEGGFLVSGNEDYIWKRNDIDLFQMTSLVESRTESVGWGTTLIKLLVDLRAFIENWIDGEKEDIYEFYMTILNTFGLGHLRGVDNLIEVVRVYPSTYSFEEVKRTVHAKASSLLEEQINETRCTLLIDVEHLRSSSEARLIPRILSIRQEEMSDIEIHIVQGKTVDLRALALTPYGFEVLEARESWYFTTIEELTIIEEDMNSLGYPIKRIDTISWTKRERLAPRFLRDLVYSRLSRIQNDMIALSDKIILLGETKYHELVKEIERIVGDAYFFMDSYFAFQLEYPMDVAKEESYYALIRTITQSLAETGWKEEEMYLLTMIDYDARLYGANRYSLYHRAIDFYTMVAESLPDNCSNEIVEHLISKFPDDKERDEDGNLIYAPHIDSLVSSILRFSPNSLVPYLIRVYCHLIEIGENEAEMTSKYPTTKLILDTLKELIESPHVNKWLVDTLSKYEYFTAIGEGEINNIIEEYKERNCSNMDSK